MFGKRMKLFKLLGFEVGIDWSWIIIAILIAWSLSTGLFPIYCKDLSTQMYWIMGIVGAVGLFLSIIIHEFCHSLVARRYGMPMKGITLFIFGGVAQMEDEPPSPKAEFMMAIVGPLSSFAIALIFYGIYLSGKQGGLPEPVRRFMKTDPVTVPASISLKELVEDYIYRHHYKMFPVMENSDKLVGCITTKQLRDVPREEWDQKKVRDMAVQCNSENTIESKEGSMKALSKMKLTGASRLMVVEGDHLVGIISLKDMLELLSLKVELEK